MVSIILGFLGYSLLNISQAVQKIGILRAKEKPASGRIIWICATLGTLASSFLVLTGVTLGRASLVGAMAGAGLASLAVFSHLVMKERVGAKELAGVLVIVGAAGLIGFFAGNDGAGAPPLSLHFDRLFLLLAVLTALAVPAWIVFRKKNGAVGIVIGLFSGSLGGFVPLFQKVATSEAGKALSLFPPPAEAASDFFRAALAGFSNPFTGVWIVLSLASMIVLQFAYRKAEVIRIIPFFSASAVVIPVIGGVLCLEEKLHMLQWLGVALLLGGLVLLTLKVNKKAAPAAA